jgi:hypothetical protein
MCSMTNTSTPQSTRRLPMHVWLLTALGAVIGALLAEPGDIIANTIPSAATFAVVGLVVGLFVWAARRRVGSNR